MIKIKKLSPDATAPRFMREGDAAMDFYANENTTIQPNERKIVSTGIAMAIPKGFVGLIWDRSGMAAKHGIKSMGGVIDSNYRGEVGIILQNLSNEAFNVEKDMRIAQLLIQPVENREILEVENLDETVRGESGFGSSGMK